MKHGANMVLERVVVVVVMLVMVLEKVMVMLVMLRCGMLVVVMSTGDLVN